MGLETGSWWGEGERKREKLRKKERKKVRVKRERERERRGIYIKKGIISNGDAMKKNELFLDIYLNPQRNIH